MNRKSKVKNEIHDLRSSLYILLDCQNSDKKSILKASSDLDKAILKYIKINKQ